MPNGPSPLYSPNPARPLDPSEIERLRMETAKLDAERREAEAKARIAEIARDREDEKRDREMLADDFRYHTYHFTGQVDPTTVKGCIDRLKVWDRQDAKCEIEIMFSSPGGGVIAGMELFDFIQRLRTSHKVTTSAAGMAASMAGILLQAGDLRVMGHEAYVLIHEVSTLTGGSMGEIEDEVEFLHKMQDRILTVFATRCQATDAPKKLTKAQLKRRWRRKNWWLSSDECLAYGLVDEVH